MRRLTVYTTAAAAAANHAADRFESFATGTRLLDESICMTRSWTFIHSRLCTTTSYAFFTLWSSFFIHVCKIFITTQSEYEPFLIFTLPRTTEVTYSRKRVLSYTNSTFTQEVARCASGKSFSEEQRKNSPQSLTLVPPQATFE